MNLRFSYNPPVPIRCPSILLVLLAALGMAWSPNLAGLLTLLPGPAVHHAHVHAHGGAAHVHVHSHDPDEHDRSAASDHLDAGAHPDDHDGVLVQVRRGPSTSPASHALLTAWSGSSVGPVERRLDRLLRPPTRAGPPSHMSHLRTVMLLV